MKNNIIFLILTIIVLISNGYYLTSLSKKGIKDKDYESYIINNYKGMFLCKGLIDNSPWNPYEITSQFSLNDKKVYSIIWFDFNNKPLGVDFVYYFKREWIGPDGNIYGTENYNTTVEKDWRGYRNTGILEVKNFKRLPGEWKVRVYINGKLLDEKTFNISDPVLLYSEQIKHIIDKKDSHLLLNHLNNLYLLNMREYSKYDQTGLKALGDILFDFNYTEIVPYFVKDDDIEIINNLFPELINFIKNDDIIFKIEDSGNNQIQVICNEEDGKLKIKLLNFIKIPKETSTDELRNFKLGSILDIIQLLENDLEKQITPGETFFGEKFAVPYIWDHDDKLLEVDDKIRERVNYLSERFGFDKDFFSLQLQANFKDKNILLVFPEKMKSYLEKEVKIGDNILLYLIVGSYNDFDKTLILLVVDFKKKKDNTNNSKT